MCQLASPVTPSENLRALLSEELISLISSYNEEMFTIQTRCLETKNKIFIYEEIQKHEKQLLDIYKSESKKVTDYVVALEQRYSEDDHIEIENMISYFTNQWNGFGRQNDEDLFEDAKKNDALYKEVLIYKEIIRDKKFLSHIVIHYNVVKRKMNNNL